MSLVVFSYYYIKTRRGLKAAKAQFSGSQVDVESTLGKELYQPLLHNAQRGGDASSIALRSRNVALPSGSLTI